MRFWLTHLMLVQLGVLLVWLANGSGGSILIAVLAHAAFNVAIGLAPSKLSGVVSIRERPAEAENRAVPCRAIGKAT